MDNDTADAAIVPGMADIVEARRVELGLTPGQLAEAAGLTRQGIKPVREGRRKAYQDKVKIGVARALGWQPDAVDRLLAGDEPLLLDEPPRSLDIATADLVHQVEELKAEVARLRDLYQPPPAS